MKRSVCALNIWQVIREEVNKLPAFLTYRIRNEATSSVNSVNKAIEFMKGKDLNEDAAMQEKRKKHRVAYEQLQRLKFEKAKKERDEKLARLSWRQKLAFYLNEAKESYKASVSSQAGVMALLEACTTSHAAEVAVELGIDVENVQMVLEQRTASRSQEQQTANTAALGTESVVVGYIDAPRATNAEVMEFAEKLQKACPMANTMHIEWRRGSPDAPSYEETPLNYNNNNINNNSADTTTQSLQHEENLTTSTTKAAEESLNQSKRMSYEEFMRKMNENASSSSSSSSSSQYVPTGMPGERRGMQYNNAEKSKHSTAAAQTEEKQQKELYHEREENKEQMESLDSEALHLPGMSSKRKNRTNNNSKSHSQE